MKAGRQNLLQWLSATMNAVNKDVARDIQEKSDAVLPIIVNDYRQHLTESMSQLQKLGVPMPEQTAAKSSRADQVEALKQLETRAKSRQPTHRRDRDSADEIYADSGLCAFVKAWLG